MAILAAVCSDEPIRQRMRKQAPQEMKEAFGTCFSRMSCDARPYKEDHLWWDRDCECGTHCLPYKTCCVDSVYSTRKLSTLRPPENVECLYLYGVPRLVKAVSRCSPDFKWSTRVVHLCESNSLLSSTVLLTDIIPVTSIETMVTYKNKHCMTCNQGLVDFMYWTYALFWKNGTTVTHSLIPLTDDPQNHFYLLYDDDKKAFVIYGPSSDIYEEVYIQFEPHSTLLPFVKPCTKEGIHDESSCVSSSFTKFKDACSKYFAPYSANFSDPSEPVFRNPDCAKCSYMLNYEFVPGAQIFKCEEMPHAHGADGFRRSRFSLEVLRGSGDVVTPRNSENVYENLVKVEAEIFRIGRNCGWVQYWEPFMEKCIDLDCTDTEYYCKNEMTPEGTFRYMTPS